MVILGIETSAKVGSVAVLGEDETPFEHSFTAGLVHGVELLPAIAGVLDDAGLNRSDIDAVAVSRGPGSYTGIRVGVAGAKTLAWALGTKVVGVCSLEVVAANAPEAAGRLHVVIDARRKRVYTQIFINSGGRLQPVTQPEVMPAEEAAERIEKGDAVTGDALDGYAELFAASHGDMTEEATWQPRAGELCRLASALINAGEHDDIYKLAPLYLHRPEAEELWEKRHGGSNKAVGGN